MKRVSQRFTESRVFLWVLQFPPTGNVDGGSLAPIADPSPVCHKVAARGDLRTPSLDQVELRPLQ